MRCYLTTGLGLLAYRCVMSSPNQFFAAKTLDTLEERQATCIYNSLPGITYVYMVLELCSAVVVMRRR